jgi:hypothetical protein
MDDAASFVWCWYVSGRLRVLGGAEAQLACAAQSMKSVWADSCSSQEDRLALLLAGHRGRRGSNGGGLRLGRRRLTTPLGALGHTEQLAKGSG